MVNCRFQLNGTNILANNDLRTLTYISRIKKTRLASSTQDVVAYAAVDERPECLLLVSISRLRPQISLQVLITEWYHERAEDIRYRRQTSPGVIDLKAAINEALAPDVQRS